MKTRLLILVLISASVSGQTIEKVSGYSTFIKGRGFKGVIFSADYELPVFYSDDKDRFTPTVEDVLRFERELRRRIKDINKDRPNQGRHYGPVIDKRQGKYSRQYAGFINSNGEKVIHVSLNWKEKGERWKKDFVLALDGGSRHWSIRYNLDKNEFFGFAVNGIAGVFDRSCVQWLVSVAIRTERGILLYRRWVDFDVHVDGGRPEASLFLNIRFWSGGVMDRRLPPVRLPPGCDWNLGCCRVNCPEERRRMSEMNG